MTKRAVLYARVSSDDRDKDGRNLTRAEKTPSPKKLFFILDARIAHQRFICRKAVFIP
jgi:predicted site-specific integrase-resolvase